MTVRELGHLVLYVHDVERSAAFYGEVLGWQRIMPGPGERPVGAAAFSSGRTHHELLLIEVGPEAAEIPAAGTWACTTSASMWASPTTISGPW